MYMSDGARGTISAFPFDAGSGRLGLPSVFATGSGDIGMPNGIAVDRDGYVWAAMLGGWAVHRYAPDGRLVEVIHLPVPMPTSVGFGGDDLATLYITSTYLRLPPGFSTLAPASGTLLAMPTDTAGQLPDRFGQPQRT